MSEWVKLLPGPPTQRDIATGNLKVTLWGTQAAEEALFRSRGTSKR